MTKRPNKPRAEQTPQGPVYQGRLLPHPEEEVVDQGVQFDVSTLMERRGLMNRRRLLGIFGGGAGVLALAACGVGAEASDSATTGSASTSELTEIPDETNGPYPADGTNGPDILEESGVVRQDIRSSFGASTTTAEGIPLTFEFTVLDMSNDDAPYAGVAVYAWQCDRDGNYSMYSSGLEDENYLRGVQIADDEGKVSFTSIFPACYSGRWPHIHFEVYPDQDSMTDADNRLTTSQMALPKDACDAVYATDGYQQSVTNLSQLTLETDNVLGDDGGEHQLGTLTGSVGDGYTATLAVAIDPTTEATSGSAPQSGGGAGGPGGAPGGTPPSGAPSGMPSTQPGTADDSN